MGLTVDGRASARRPDDDATTPPPAAARAAETSPAPPSARGGGEIRTDVPSAHPTSVPEFDCAALALGTFAFDSHANLPLDLAVPSRIAGADASGLEHAAAFVLMHVDDVSTISTIAATAGMALPEVIGHFLGMLAQGIVAIADRPSAEARPPVSGVYAPWRE